MAVKSFGDERKRFRCNGLKDFTGPMPDKDSENIRTLNGYFSSGASGKNIRIQRHGVFLGAFPNNAEFSGIRMIRIPSTWYYVEP